MYSHLTPKQFFFRWTLSESLGRAPLFLRFLSRPPKKLLVLAERSLQHRFLINLVFPHSGPHSTPYTPVKNIVPRNPPTYPPVTHRDSCLIPIFSWGSSCSQSESLAGFSPASRRSCSRCTAPETWRACRVRDSKGRMN